MYTKDFFIDIPKNLIANYPQAQRDGSRLLVVEKSTGKVEHRLFTDIVSYFSSDDVLVLNNTRVQPVRLIGVDKNKKTVDFILTKRLGQNRYEILLRGNYTGPIDILDIVKGEIYGGKEIVFHGNNAVDSKLEEIGQMPLPPYIKREPDDGDKVRYQTVYAKTTGSIAAPTAGIHFTKTLLADIQKKGVTLLYLTLHVGTGTFKPIRSENVENHVMDSEWFEIEENVLNKITAAKSRGSKVFLVGTTTVRTLEAHASSNYTPIKGANGKICGRTSIFMYPGHKFAVPDCLVTNFHQPASTPLMLVSAFLGKEFLFKAYKEAIKQSYRFFSYGDAMLIL